MQRRDIKVDGILDLEAQDWTTFVAGGLLYRGNYQEFWWDREEELVERLRYFEGTCWAHFGGGYDYKWLLDWFASFGLSPEVRNAGPRITRIKLFKAEFCDSFALVPMSLEKLTKGFGISKIKLGLACSCGLDCGGFCRVRRDMPEEDRKLLSKYLRKDCESLEHALQELRKFAQENDLDLGQTIGSSAWRNLRRKTSIGPAYLDGTDYDFVDDAYFGGRTQVYKYFPHWNGDPEKNPYAIKEAFEWDVNSMYPYCLTLPLPVGDYMRIIGSDAQNAFMHERPGFYKCTVDVPEMFIPPLPVRFNNDTSIGYPFGEFEGTWALPELLHAQSLGVKVTVHEAMVWDDAKPIFEAWVKRGWDIRASAPVGGKSGPLGTEMKLILNSAIGKMGASPEQEVIEINPAEVLLCDCDWRKPCEKGHHRQLSQHIFSREETYLQDCAHIELAAYALSYARVRLHRGQLLNGLRKDGTFDLSIAGWDMLYSDTDSKYRTTNIQEWYKTHLESFMHESLFGDDLGQWQAKGACEDFVCNAPKTYSYRRKDKKGVVQLEAKAKGIALPKKTINAGTEEEERVYFERPIVGKVYSKSRVVGFKAGAKLGKFFSKFDLTRTINVRTGDRLIARSKYSTGIPYPERCTYPPHIKDLNNASAEENIDGVQREFAEVG